MESVQIKIVKEGIPSILVLRLEHFYCGFAVQKFRRKAACLERERKTPVTLDSPWTKPVQSENSKYSAVVTFGIALSRNS